MRAIMFRSLSSLMLAGIAPAALALPPGMLDPSFNGTGKQTVPLDLYASPNGGMTMLIDAEQRPYLIGTVRLQTMQQAIGIVRLPPDGGVDGTFPQVAYLPDSLQNVAVRDATWQGDGRLVVVGQAPTQDGTAMLACRFEADGSPDTAFGDAETPGCARIVKGTQGIANAVAVQPDGDIVVAGSFTINGVRRAAVAALDESGHVALEFGDAGFRVGLNAASTLHDLAVNGEGGVVAAGEFEWDATDHDFLIARFDENGDPLPGWGNGGWGIYVVDVGTGTKIDQGRAVQFMPDGGLIVAGRAEISSVPGPEFNVVVVKFHPDGSEDETFLAPPTGLDEAEHVYFLCQSPTNFCDVNPNDLLVLPDGQVLVAGTVVESPPDETPEQQLAHGDFFVMRLQPGGLPDPGFSSQGMGKKPFARIGFDLVDGMSRDVALRVALQDEKILVAGYARASGEEGDEYDFAIARIGNGPSQIFADSFEDAP